MDTAQYSCLGGSSSTLECQYGGNNVLEPSLSEVMFNVELNDGHCVVLVFGGCQCDAGVSL